MAASSESRNKRMLQKDKKSSLIFEHFKEARRKKIKQAKQENNNDRNIIDWPRLEYVTSNINKTESSNDSKNLFIRSNSIATLSRASNMETHLSIICTVTRKGELRNWNDGKVFDIELKDNTGTIRATAWNEQAQIFYPTITLGRKYVFEKPWIKIIREEEKCYYDPGHIYKITLTKCTRIMEYKYAEEDNRHASYLNEKYSAGKFVKGSYVKIERCKETFDVSTIPEDIKITTNTGENYYQLLHEDSDSDIEMNITKNKKLLQIMESSEERDSIPSENESLDQNDVKPQNNVIMFNCSNNNNHSVTSSSDERSEEFSEKKSSASSIESSSEGDTETMSDFIDDSKAVSSKYHAILDKEIKHLSRQTSEDIANKKNYEKCCRKPQLGTTDKVRKEHQVISEELRKALKSKSSGKHKDLHRFMREFRFLYTTEDQSQLSSCICGAPGAMRLKNIHWYVNSKLYKSAEQQEKHKFKIGSTCAYWLEVDPEVFRPKISNKSKTRKNKI